MDYQFLCDCRACLKDFPQLTADSLEVGSKSLAKLAQKAYNSLYNSKKVLTRDEAMMLAIQYSIVLQQNYREKLYPNREIVLLQLCITKCFLVASQSSLNFA